MESFLPTERTRVRRLAKRGVYDRETVYQILDEAVICHVAFLTDGRVNVLPTGFGRSGDTLYIHGSPASRLLRALSGGIEVSIAVTLLDGLVLARSAFHHSMNYRSVIIYGTAVVVEDPAQKMEALRIFTEHAVPGRWETVRRPSAQELRATTVLAVPLEEVSAKVRTGPPVDDEEDMGVPVWAGVIPLKVSAEEPVADAATPPSTRPHPTPSRFSR